MKGDELDPAQVSARHLLEMDSVMRQKVFLKVPLEQGLKEPGRLHDMKSRNTNKTDKVRSSLVVREIKSRRKEHERLDASVVSASMPPIGGVKR